MDFLCLDFINSQWYNTHDLFMEPLRDRKWTGEFFERWGINLNAEISDNQLNQLITLRTLLFNIIEDLNGSGEIENERLKGINHYLSLVPLNYELKKDGKDYSILLEPAIKNWNYVLNRIARSLIEIISEYGTGRVKMCENQACRWAFLDESKNHSRKWCGSTCSSLIKVRRFREKKKH